MCIIDHQTIEGFLVGDAYIFFVGVVLYVYSCKLPCVIGNLWLLLDGFVQSECIY